MLQHKAYKYRIYPNQEQRTLIHQLFGCCRFVVNHFLSIWKDTYAATGSGLSYNHCAIQLPALKREFLYRHDRDENAAYRDTTRGYEISRD
ncbi:helix-turn-helix domain-containing protein [Paenibacillus harenae]|uniref:helix-turn-helix domain-containing protein n=1 Tax=Paenibacillus harenae TaxID=306543 RepID=UPI003CCBAEDB